MSDSSAVMLGAIVSGLFGAYFIASFAFVAYVLRKYDSLKDELRFQQARIDRMSSLEVLVRGHGAKSLDPEAQSSHGE